MLRSIPQLQSHSDLPIPPPKSFSKPPGPQQQRHGGARRHAQRRYASRWLALAPRRYYTCPCINAYVYVYMKASAQACVHCTCT